MANFDEIKKVAAEKAEVIAEKAAELARAAAEKTKVMARIGRLNTEILAEKDAIRKATLELGKIYYEYFKVDPHDPMKDACARIDAAYAAIAAKKAEIEELKTAQPDVEVEFTEEPVEEPAEEPCCGEKADEAEAEEPCCCGEAEEKDETAAPCCCEEKAEEPETEQ